MPSISPPLAIPPYARAKARAVATVTSRDDGNTPQTRFRCWDHHGDEIAGEIRVAAEHLVIIVDVLALPHVKIDVIQH
jgi:hypothetical protein